MTRPAPSPWRALTWLLLGIMVAAIAVCQPSTVWRALDVVFACIDMLLAGLVLGAWSEQEGRS